MAALVHDGRDRDPRKPAAEGATGVDRVLAEIQLTPTAASGRLARVQCRSRVTPASPRENRSAIESLHFWATEPVPNAAPTLLRSRDRDSWTRFPRGAASRANGTPQLSGPIRLRPGPEPLPGGSLHSEASAGASASSRYRLPGALLVSTASESNVARSDFWSCARRTIRARRRLCVLTPAMRRAVDSPARMRHTCFWRAAGRLSLRSRHLLRCRCGNHAGWSRGFPDRSAGEPRRRGNATPVRPGH